ALLADSPVGILATVRPDGSPHVVPFVFAISGRTLYWAVDRKPKRTEALQRLSNISANPGVEVLVHRYEEDWSRLWWVRATGTARTGARARLDVDVEWAPAFELVMQLAATGSVDIQATFDQVPPTFDELRTRLSPELVAALELLGPAGGKNWGPLVGLCWHR